MPAGARGLLRPVRWGWLAVVAGAHAAGLGLLASGVGERQTSAAPASSTTISVRIIGAAREASTSKAVPASATDPAAAAPAEAPGSAAAPQAMRPPAEAVAASSEEPAVAAVPPPAASRAAERPKSGQRASARSPAEPVPAPQPSPPVSTSSAMPAPPDLPVQQAMAPALALAAAEPADAPRRAAAEGAHSPVNDSPAATTQRDATPAPPPIATTAAAPIAAPAGSQAALAAPASLLPARYDADYLDNPTPAYPSISRRMGEQGTVLLRVRVMSDGLPQEIEILTASGSPRLDRAAADAVRGWRFAPATQGGAAVDSWLRVPIVFRLDD